MLMDFAKFWDEQAAWSRATFGADHERGPIGPLKHLAKELKEVRAEIERPMAAGHLAEEADRKRRVTEEVADLVFLTFDACRRSGRSFADLDDDTGLLHTVGNELWGIEAEVEDAIAGRSDINLWLFAHWTNRIGVAAWKLGIGRDELLAACFAKLEVNKNRTWPKPGPADEPVEHVRTEGEDREQ
jgi:hypothetical protein